MSTIKGSVGSSGLLPSNSKPAAVWGDAYAEAGVVGSSNQGYGVQGLSNQSAGVYGSTNQSIGVMGASGGGVVGVMGYNGPPGLDADPVAQAEVAPPCGVYGAGNSDGVVGVSYEAGRGVYGE